nr:MAG TPA_asm: hypothetical protein [Caudoviricetes sp.]
MPPHKNYNLINTNFSQRQRTQHGYGMWNIRYAHYGKSVCSKIPLFIGIQTILHDYFTHRYSHTPTI